MQTWLITGCSSGIGEALVIGLLAAGKNVIASGRNADLKLAHLKETGAAILDLDVTSSPEIIDRKSREALTIFPGGIDVLVNNAGYCHIGAFEELRQQDMRNLMDVLFHGPLNLTRSILPHLREKGSGALIYTGSMYGWGSDPSLSAYAASKAALATSVGCLADELAMFAPGIRTMVVEPGSLHTKAQSNYQLAKPSLSAYTGFSENLKRGVENAVHPGDVNKLANRIIELAEGTGMAQGKVMPRRIVMGSDGFGFVKAKLQAALNELEEWEEVSMSTDIKAKM